jgi:hypothetical protein
LSTAYSHDNAMRSEPGTVVTGFFFDGLDTVSFFAALIYPVTAFPVLTSLLRTKIYRMSPSFL